MAQTTVKLSGPLFQPGALGVFARELQKGIEAVDEEFVDEVEKRLKPGKGYRSGRYKGSFGNVKKSGELTAVSEVTDKEVQRYAHSVEYGNVRGMRGQNQRKNARQSINRSLKNPMSQRSQKLIKRAVEKLN